MKVIVYQYIGSYGGGLLFLSDECEQEQKWMRDSDDYEKLGVFDLSQDFLNAISWNKKFDGYDDLTYVE